MLWGTREMGDQSGHKLKGIAEAYWRPTESEIAALPLQCNFFFYVQNT